MITFTHTYYVISHYRISNYKSLLNVSEPRSNTRYAERSGKEVMDSTPSSFVISSQGKRTAKGGFYVCFLLRYSLWVYSCRNIKVSGLLLQEHQGFWITPAGALWFLDYSCRNIIVSGLLVQEHQGLWIYSCRNINVSGLLLQEHYGFWITHAGTSLFLDVLLQEHQCFWITPAGALWFLDYSCRNIMVSGLLVQEHHCFWMYSCRGHQGFWM